MTDEGDGPTRDSDADEEGDPFDSLDDPATEADDPFAELGAGVEGDSEKSSPVGSDPTDVDTEDVNADPDADDFESERSPTGGVPSAGRDDPFDEIGPADPGTDLDDAFEQMDVGGAAEEDVWASLDSEIGLDGATSIPGEDDTEHIVSKRTYCQQCPHFTPPPEVACDHEGTTILEAVDFDRFRLQNCPMISEEDPTFDDDE